MTASSKTLTVLFADLRDSCFKKKGLVWCRRTDETVFSFELQKSAHAERYFVNIGIWLLPLGQTTHLPPNRCHVYGRFGDSAIEAALDFGVSAIPDREGVIGRFKGEELLPMAEKCGTVKGVAEVLASETLRVPRVRPEARVIL